jgi:hypothetical protein
MALPGFNAETSLYKTSVHYRLAGALVQPHGVMPQQALCSLCHCGANAQCVSDCRICEAVFPGGTVHCYNFTEPCNSSACHPDCCTEARNLCLAEVGCLTDCSNMMGSNGCVGCDCCPPCCFRCGC